MNSKFYIDFQIQNINLKYSLIHPYKIFPMTALNPSKVTNPAPIFSLNPKTCITSAINTKETVPETKLKANIYWPNSKMTSISYDYITEYMTK